MSNRQRLLEACIKVVTDTSEHVSPEFHFFKGLQCKLQTQRGFKEEDDAGAEAEMSNLLSLSKEK